MNIGILLYDNFTMLDAMGPYEVLARMPEVRIIFVGLEKKEYKDQYGTSIKVNEAIGNIQQLNILLIPGGFGINNLLNNQTIIDWIVEIDKTSEWTIAVCSGALLLAQAGLLNGRKCTTHWRRKEELRKYKVNIVNERYVQDSKYVTSAGVSAGIDMALFLISKIAGETAAKMIQRGIEYDPQPPFDYDSIEKIPPEIIE